MNKILIAVAAALLAAAALFASSAQAGFNLRLKAPTGFSTVEKAGCKKGYRRAAKKRRYRSVRSSSKRKAYIARKKAKSSIAVAKAKAPKLEAKKDEAPEQVAETENSSISTANGKVAQAEPVKAEDKREEKVAAANDVGCKQFFPSVGMTLSVPCE